MEIEIIDENGTYRTIEAVQADGLTDLIARCESAGESEQRELVIEVAKLLHGPYRTDWPGRSIYRFRDLLNAEAYLSAAEMLVPPATKHWNVGGGERRGFGSLGLFGACIDDVYYGEASTPALALLAASLRAMEKQG